ncbi:NAD(P)H-dependent oxidoreductase [Candidatus Omnitrophota bacterium]
MEIIRELLVKRQRNKEPIEVAIVGSGLFGSGLIRELCHWPGMVPRLVVTLLKERAVESLRFSGVSSSDIVEVHTGKELKKAIAERKYVITDDLALIKEASAIDVVFEATGDVEVGAQAALIAFDQNKHFLTVNSEMDATIGCTLSAIAKERSIVYSNSDGDQPGVLMRMINELTLQGFDIVVAGNGKGFLNYYATPDSVRQWVREVDNPKLITSATDGTKQGLELTVLANATGLVPDARGMHGPKVTKETIIEEFLKRIAQEGIIDYAMGTNVNLGKTVFVIGKREEAVAKSDLEYFGIGEGPYYLFFKGYHLCYFEAPRTIADAALFNLPSMAPQKRVADVFAVAKRDLHAGEKLDGIGGYTVYGLIDKSEIIKKEQLLPLGIAEYAVLKTNIRKDTPITYEMVDLPNNRIAVSLRKKEEALID